MSLREVLAGSGIFENEIELVFSSTKSDHPSIPLCGM